MTRKMRKKKKSLHLEKDEGNPLSTTKIESLNKPKDLETFLLLTFFESSFSCTHSFLQMLE